MKRIPRTLLRLALAAVTTTVTAASANASLLDYVGQCVPFARAASGIQIYGNAWTWWSQADGKYERTHTPKEGAVIVFEKTKRLPMGHVAVVSRVVEKRVVMLTHANWSRQNGECPLSISNSITPTDHRSVRPSWSSPRHCSGDM